MKGAGYVVWMDETGTRGALRSDAVTRTARGGSVKAGMHERRKKADRWRVILGESGRPPPSPPSPPLPSSPLPTSAATVAAGAGFRDTGSQDERRRVIPDRRSEPATPGLAPPHLCSRCGLIIPGGERKALSHWVTSCLRHLTRLPPPATPLGGFPSAVADAEAGGSTVSSATQEALNPSLRLRPSRSQEQRSSGGSSSAAAAAHHHRRLTPTNLGDHASWGFSEVRLRNVVGAKHAFSVCSGFSAMPDAAATTTTAAASRERSGSGTRSGSGGGAGRGAGGSACSDEFEVFALRSEGGGGGGGSDGYDDDDHDLFLRTCAGLGAGDDPLSCTRVAAEDARMSALCEQIQEADAQLKRAVECVAQSFDIDALPVESRSEHLASLERLLQQLQPTPPQSPSAEKAAAAEQQPPRVVECSSAATQTQTLPEVAVAVAAPRRRPTIASLSAETLQRVFRGHTARQRLRLLARSLRATEAAVVEGEATEPAAVEASAGVARPESAPADVPAGAQAPRPGPSYTALLAARCRAEHAFVGALVGRAPQAPRPAEASRVVVRRRPAAAVRRPVKLRPQSSDAPAADA